MIVRVRTEADLEGCVRVARAVQSVDGYPHPSVGDLRAFLASSDAFEAWVAEEDGKVVGHVALRSRSSPEVMELAARVTGQPLERLAVVARLCVSPSSRGQGFGHDLLHIAANDAAGRGRWPVLDVATHFEAANKLYERCGWSRAGRVTVPFRDDIVFDEFVYIAPRPTSL
jgi:ribosomal protein S18 acetylase RimI-like enzyme